jgi:predicted Fe-Mo cluster-binding NifX family protein
MIVELDVYLRNKDMNTINNIAREVSDMLKKAGVHFIVTRENIPKKLNILHTIYIKVFNDYDGTSRRIIDLLNKYSNIIASVDVYVKKSI